MEDIKQFFDFLKEKEGKDYPLIYKLIYNPESITPEDLNVKGSLYLDQIRSVLSLPDNLEVGGDLYLQGTKITSLPNNLKVGGSLFIQTCPIKDIPKNMFIEQHFYCKGTPLARNNSRVAIRSMVMSKGGSVRGGILA
jgi:hypothetical protein